MAQTLVGWIVQMSPGVWIAQRTDDYGGGTLTKRTYGDAKKYIQDAVSSQLIETEQTESIPPTTNLYLLT